MADAVHLLPPGGSNEERAELKDVKDLLDTSLEPYLAIVACETGKTCDPPGAPGDVRLQGRKYRQLIDLPKAVRGRTVTIKVYVAGLEVAALPYAGATMGRLVVQFQIEAHPRIRARVLRVQGLNSSEIAAALKAEFDLSGFESALILRAEGFSALDVARTLAVLYTVTAEDMASWLVYAGYPQVDILLALEGAFAIGLSDLPRIMRAAGFTAASVYQALKQAAPSRTIEQNELDLQRAGFCLDDVFFAIQLDLVTRYTSWINDLGPVLQLKEGEDDDDLDSTFRTEVFNPASMEWFMDRSFVQWILPNCPPVDLVNGSACNTPEGAVSPEALDDLIESFRTNSAFLTGYGVDPGNPAAVQEFLGWMNFRVVPAGPSGTLGPLVLRGEDNALTPAYVNVIRNKTPNTKEFGTTDLQFWYFYPFNGPGRIQTFVHVGTTNEDERYVNPLGTHAPDWEVITLRINNTPFPDGSPFLLKVMGSAHGDVNTYWESWAAPALCNVPFNCWQTPGMYFYNNQGGLILNETGLGPGGHHPLLLASGNGHAIYPLYGTNKDTLFQKDFGADIGISMYAINWTSFGRQLPSPGHSELMSVYDTCVYALSIYPGICQGAFPVQTTNDVFVPTFLNDYPVTMGDCRFPAVGGGLLVRPYKNGKFLGEQLDYPGKFPAAHMRAICPRSFTVRPDGSAAPDASWFFTGHFGPELEYTLSDDAWEDWVKDVLLGDFLGGLSLPVITDIVDAILDLIKEPVIKAALGQPSSPESPLWKGCGLGKYSKC